MAKYIKQEMVDLSGKGEEKVYYRIQTQRNLDLKEFAEYIGSHNSLMNKALVENVLAHVTDALAKLLGNGYSVTIDGLGTFKATVGLEKDKEMDSFDKKETKRNAQSLRLTGINYRADKALIKEANRHCKLERGGESRLHQSPYSKEERLKLALEYIGQNGAMRVIDYMGLTSLSRTKATLELKEFREDASSGITTLGRGSAKVYVKAKTQE
jgi:predicted histone-like DNA-binding protein